MPTSTRNNRLVTFVFDQLLVIDLEATCWLGPPPEGQRNEIIEIGVATLDLASFAPLRRESILVKPLVSEISAFCTELTSITPEMAAAGVTLAEACQWLNDEFDAQSRMWGSWGSYDLKMLTAQCKADDVTYPFSAHHVNIKRIYGKLTRQKQGMGLKVALEQLAFGFDGTHHRGVDDAHNTARIVQHVLTTYGLEAFVLAIPKKDRPPL